MTKGKESFLELSYFAEEVNNHLENGQISIENAKKFLDEMHLAFQQIKSSRFEERTSEHLRKTLSKYLD